MSKTKKQIGKLGEDAAEKFLLENDYTILKRNYRWARGEIDIIAQKNGTLVFVEVKTARQDKFGNPETWVNQRKQKQIGSVAEGYLQEYKIAELDCRFDVIAVTNRGSNWQIRHIENAFWL